MLRYVLLLDSCLRNVSKASLATSTCRCYLLHAIAESYLNTSKIRIGEDVQNKIKFVSVKVILYQLVIKA